MCQVAFASMDIDKAIPLAGHFCFSTMGRNYGVNWQCLEIHKRENKGAVCGNYTVSLSMSDMLYACMDKMPNLGISLSGNLAFGGEIYRLDGYFGLFLPNISENV